MVALKQLRRQAGLTQGQLATRAGVSVSTVQGIEQGRGNCPNRSTLTLLAWALGVSVDTIELPYKNGRPR